MWKFLACVLLVAGSYLAAAQDSTLAAYNLDDCLRFALQAQPSVRQARIDESIARATNRINLSAGLPQVALNATYSHYLELPTSFIPNFQNPASTDRIRTQTGVANTLIPTGSATQTLFNNEVLSALRTSPLFNRQARENTAATRIDVIANVSRAYYDVLLSKAQIVVLSEDTARLGRNLRDAYSQYVAGIVDKVDYKRATISLNNSTADLKNAEEAVRSKTAALKQAMGFPPARPLELINDTSAMSADSYIDTTSLLDPARRIEFRQLHTAQQLQHETTAYFVTAFLPNVSAFYNYVPTFQSAETGALFNNIYPYSLYGISFSLPIFQGFRRVASIQRSRLQEERLYWDEVALRQRINTEYQSALADYKSNFNTYTAARENVQLAREVYEVIRLQYREGIKQYLEVIVAQSDLRASEINYLNGLYRLLTSRVNLQQALGDIQPDPPQ
jgi:outer membrane protein